MICAYLVAVGPFVDALAQPVSVTRTMGIRGRKGEILRSRVTTTLFAH